MENGAQLKRLSFEHVLLFQYSAVKCLWCTVLILNITLVIICIGKVQITCTFQFKAASGRCIAIHLYSVYTDLLSNASERSPLHGTCCDSTLAIRERLNIKYGYTHELIWVLCVPLLAQTVEPSRLLCLETLLRMPCFTNVDIFVSTRN